MHIAQAHQHGDIWFVGVFVQRIAKEEYGLDAAFSHLRCDLGISAQWAAQHAVHLQSGFLDKSAGRSCGDQFDVLSLKKRKMVADKAHHVCFLSVVCDQSDLHFFFSWIYE